LHLAVTIAPILILTILFSWIGIPSLPPPTAESTFAIQTSPQYVTLLTKVPASTPSPFLIYPTNTTIWVAGVSAPPNPPGSQIRQFFIDGTSRGVLNLTNVIVSSIVADPTNPSGKLWFTENSTLSFYDATQAKETKAITFPGQSLQYLTNDTNGRIWISMASSSGASSIAVYDPVSHANQTYAVPTSGAIIQGITVAPGNTIWFAEAGSKKIGRLVPGVPPIFSEFSPPASISLAAPVQVAVDASGNVWFTDHGSNQFGVFDPQASTWKAFPIGYCLNNCISGLPNAIFLDARNTIWFSEHIAGRIARYDPSTGVLTEYSVPGSNAPYIWWAMPGPKNLVWFVAFALGQIGYVNASIPVATGLNSAVSELTVQRGSYQRVPITVSSASHEKFSLNSSEVTQDASGFYPPQIYSSSESDIVSGGNPYSTSVLVFAAWNATLGRRYVALTAFDSKVSLSVFVRVNVIDSSISYVAVGSVLAIMLGSLIIFVRRPRGSSARSVGRVRK
jgi:streptogramin lyase